MFNEFHSAKSSLNRFTNRFELTFGAATVCRRTSLAILAIRIGTQIEENVRGIGMTQSYGVMQCRASI